MTVSGVCAVYDMLYLSALSPAYFPVWVPTAPVLRVLELKEEKQDFYGEFTENTRPKH